MRMNRRNVLLGLGTVVAGGGAALGTGAFSQVDANRTASISVAADSSALLSLDGKTSSQLINETADGLLEIKQDNINLQATTRVDKAIDITNKGGQPVEISVSLDTTETDISDSEAISIFSLEYNADSTDTPESGDSLVTTSNDLIADSDDGSPWVFANGDDVTLDLVIDTTQVSSLSGGDDLIDGMTVSASAT